MQGRAREREEEDPATRRLAKPHRTSGGRPLRRPGASELLLATSGLGLAVGGVAWLVGARGGASLAWTLTTAAGIGPLVGSVVAGLRRRELGVDVIALLAMAGPCCWRNIWRARSSR